MESVHDDAGRGGLTATYGVIDQELGLPSLALGLAIWRDVRYGE